MSNEKKYNLVVKEVANLDGLRLKRVVWGGVVDSFSLNDHFLWDENKLWDEKKKAYVDVSLSFGDSLEKENLFPAVVTTEDSSGKERFFLITKPPRK